MRFLPQPGLRIAWGAILVGVVLLLASVACFVHLDDTGHEHLTPDACALVVITTLSAALLARPHVSGRRLPEPLALIYSAPRHLLDPPPKSPSHS